MFYRDHANTSSPFFGRRSAPSGSVLGGNSNAESGASKEEQISSSEIEDRSCWTGEPAETGSPARGLQLNESHLAKFLTISVGRVG